MKLCGIYKITSPTNRVYIGQSIDIIRRFNTYSHLYYPKSQPKLYASLKKHGAKNHKFEVLELCEKDSLNAREKFYIQKFKSFGTYSGLNLKSHSDRGCNLSKETRLKISKSNKGKGRGVGWKHTDEAKQKISLGHKGKSYGVGKKISKETRRKISKTLTGIKFSEERRNNIRIGILNSEKTNRRKITQFSLEGDFIKHWPSASNVNDVLGYDSSCILKVCKNKLKKAYGFKWKYA